LHESYTCTLSYVFMEQCLGTILPCLPQLRDFYYSRCSFLRKFVLSLHHLKAMNSVGCTHQCIVGVMSLSGAKLLSWLPSPTILWCNIWHELSYASSFSTLSIVCLLVQIFPVLLATSDHELGFNLHCAMYPHSEHNAATIWFSE
jgi:hypothetical protein